MFPASPDVANVLPSGPLVPVVPPGSPGVEFVLPRGPLVPVELPASPEIDVVMARGPLVPVVLTSGLAGLVVTPIVGGSAAMLLAKVPDS